MQRRQPIPGIVFSLPPGLCFVHSRLPVFCRQQTNPRGSGRLESRTHWQLRRLEVQYRIRHVAAAASLRALRSARIRDRGVCGDTGRTGCVFYTDADLGPRQSTLPSGSLWCRDVTIARCGTRLYHPSEIGEDGDDMVMVQRDPDEVFAETAMASFEAAPVTFWVILCSRSMPSNWSRLAMGHVQNVRRDGDLLIGDLIIHDRRAIDAIRNRGWRAISCGYDASYRADRRRADGASQYGRIGDHLRCARTARGGTLRRAVFDRRCSTKTETTDENRHADDRPGIRRPARQASQAHARSDQRQRRDPHHLESIAGRSEHRPAPRHGHGPRSLGER